uniref:Uncharacterized protein n=1 Tax=Rhodnius prolixus TaxID=13249 RepID=T1HJJ1_RHOPR
MEIIVCLKLKCIRNLLSLLVGGKELYARCTNTTDGHKDKCPARTSYTYQMIRDLLNNALIRNLLWLLDLTLDTTYLHCGKRGCLKLLCGSEASAAVMSFNLFVQILIRNDLNNDQYRKALEQM